MPLATQKYITAHVISDLTLQTAPEVQCFRLGRHCSHPASATRRVASSLSQTCNCRRNTRLNSLHVARVHKENPRRRLRAHVDDSAAESARPRRRLRAFPCLQHSLLDAFYVPPRLGGVAFNLLIHTACAAATRLFRGDRRDCTSGDLSISMSIYLSGAWHPTATAAVGIPSKPIFQPTRVLILGRRTKQTGAPWSRRCSAPHAQSAQGLRRWRLQHQWPAGVPPS